MATLCPSRSHCVPHSHTVPLAATLCPSRSHCVPHGHTVSLTVTLYLTAAHQISFQTDNCPACLRWTWRAGSGA
eukprot:365522-Chlamydomonas_euryale.AAC.13